MDYKEFTVYRLTYKSRKADTLFPQCFGIFLLLGHTAIVAEEKCLLLDQIQAVPGLVVSSLFEPETEVRCRLKKVLFRQRNKDKALFYLLLPDSIFSTILELLDLNLHEAIPQYHLFPAGFFLSLMLKLCSLRHPNNHSSL